MSKICFKIIIIGDLNVGKTSMINRYVYNSFSERYKATIGVDLFKKDLKYKNNKVSLQLWDTAGVERFQAVTPSFYRGSDACVLVFDLTNNKSFESLEQWIDEFLIYANPQDPDSFPFIILGNKSDLLDPNDVNNIIINRSRIERFCKMKNIKYFSVSAKNNENIFSAFSYLINKLMKSDTDAKNNELESNNFIEYTPTNYYTEDLTENYDKKISTNNVQYVYPDLTNSCYC
jgi:Ras-related protein Rab-7A